MGFSATASIAVSALTMSLIAFGLALKLNFTVLFIVVAELSDEAKMIDEHTAWQL